MIEIRNVWKSFERKTVLKNLSLNIFEGEVFAIVGPSGAGKSTLLDLLAGLSLPDQGEIRMGDCRLTTGSKNCACRQIQTETGFMFQEGALMDFLNVFDNVALPLKEAGKIPPGELRQRVLGLLGDLDLLEAQDLYPHELSGGMTKRVALARAIVRRPKVLLVDEPTSGLDPTRAKVTLELIRRLHSKYSTTAVIITHDIQGVHPYADRVGLLCEGNMAAIEEVKNGSFPSSDMLRKFLRGELENHLGEESHGTS